MFKVTEAAAEQVKRAAQQSGTEGMALRLAAKRNEDGSIEYLIGFDEAKDEDISFNSTGVDIVMAPEYGPLLDQATMDYVQLDEGDRQFIFHNPIDPTYVPCDRDRRAFSPMFGLYRSEYGQKWCGATSFSLAARRLQRDPEFASEIRFDQS